MKLVATAILLLSLVILLSDASAKSIERPDNNGEEVFAASDNDDQCTKRLMKCEKKLAALTERSVKLRNHTTSQSYVSNSLQNHNMDLERQIEMLKHRIEHPQALVRDIPRTIGCVFPNVRGYSIGKLEELGCYVVLSNCNEQVKEERKNIKEYQRTLKSLHREIQYQKKKTLKLQGDIRDLNLQLEAVLLNLHTDDFLVMSTQQQSVEAITQQPPVSQPE